MASASDPVTSPPSPATVRGGFSTTPTLSTPVLSARERAVPGSEQPTATSSGRTRIARSSRMVSMMPAYDEAGATSTPPTRGEAEAHMRASTRDWLATRSHVHEDFDAARLAAAVAAKGERVSVVIPARDEAATVGDVVAVLRRDLVETVPLVHELVVIDSDSTDATAQVATDAGATVHRSADIAPHLGTHPGKGEALWKSLFVTSGDHLVFVDADLTSWGPHFVTGLVGALTTHPGTLLVKGWYDRVLAVAGRAPTTEGGRVTELVARPVLDLWWPELAAVVQPLAGEWAARRTLMEQLTVPTGYGVEIASLIDAHADRKSVVEGDR